MDQIKTDRRDARKLADYFSAGLLTECFVLDSELLSVWSSIVKIDDTRTAFQTNCRSASKQFTPDIEEVRVLVQGAVDYDSCSCSPNDLVLTVTLSSVMTPTVTVNWYFKYSLFPVFCEFQ